MYYQPRNHANNGKDVIISIIWEDEMDMCNTHMGKVPIGIRIYDKDYIHNLNQEASKNQRVIMKFDNSEKIKEEWRGKHVIVTPDLQSCQIVSDIEKAVGSWTEILENRNLIIIN